MFEKFDQALIKGERLTEDAITELLANQDFAKRYPECEREDVASVLAERVAERVAGYEGFINEHVDEHFPAAERDSYEPAALDMWQVIAACRWLAIQVAILERARALGLERSIEAHGRAVELIQASIERRLERLGELPRLGVKMAAAGTPVERMIPALKMDDQERAEADERARSVAA
jgi:hypothetical protein